MFTKIASGTVIGGRFEVQELAGTGEMGVIYRARDRSTGAAVALKIRPDDPASPSGKRFAREIKVLSELCHPGIVGYVAHGFLRNGRAFLVREWVDGEDLSARLQRGSLALPDCVAILRQVVSALAAAHRVGIIHRDIRPDTIFLCDCQFDRVVIVDFGLARPKESSVTGSGVLVGSPQYMAPEQARAQGEIGPSVDLFSLGCVLFHAVTGKPPFPAEHFAAMLAKVLFEEHARVGELVPGVPSALDGLIHRLMSKHPSHRPRDAVALEEELLRLPSSWLLTEGAEGAGLSRALPQARMGGEQKLFSVVMASPRRAAPSNADGPIDAEDAGPPAAKGPLRHALLDNLSDFGARVEWLEDGSLVATLSRPSSSVADLVGVAARFALAMKERWPEAGVALATGVGALRDHRVPAGEAMDRIAQLVRERSLIDAGAPQGSLSGVWLDDASARLLGGRFEQAKAGGGSLLVRERPCVDPSCLLGKPTRCVGREQVIAPILTMLSGSIEASLARAVLVKANAGIGKSRVGHELIRRLSERYPEVNVLIGCGDPLCVGSPYGLIRQAMQKRLGIQGADPAEEQRERLARALSRTISPHDLPRVSRLLGEVCGVPFADESSEGHRASRMDPKVLNDELLRALLEWLRAECAAAPVLLVLEDLQWGDLLTLRLLSAAMRELFELPFMVLALARPEVSEVFPKMWGWVAQEISLLPLSRKACEEVIEEALGKGLPRPVISRIVEQSEGNAFYLEELIRAEAEGRRDEPPEALLMMQQARILRLDEGSRRALRAASVFGDAFWIHGVEHLLGGSGDDVTRWLPKLIELGIIEPQSESRLPGETELRFRSALLREAAYRLITDADRAEAHAAASHFLEKAGEPDLEAIAEHSRRARQ